eukprot:Phypoly_transcript_01951.p1 GENE.Phypoly_transcript_01951~~Phypoly_transcript_01951.p1  ORF type:complete len:1014 (+),score=130.64 Phypoly_transcript_01951:264-3044(+)
MAIISLGAVAVVANRQIPAHIMSQMFVSCGVSFLYIENGSVAELDLAHANDIKIIGSADTTLNGFSRDENTTASQLEDVQSSDPAFIMFTSGTTSVPKGVLHTHSSLLHGAESKRATFEAILEPNGAILGLLPLFHALGFTSTFLFSLYSGLRYAFFQAPVTPELYATAIKKVRPFLFDTVPWIIEELAAICKNDTVLLEEMKKLKHVSFGGGRLSPQTEKFFHENGVALGMDYGQTELGTSVFHGGLTREEKEGWKRMIPMRGVNATLEPVEGVEGGELIILNSKTLALGYIIEGDFVPLPREAHHTNDIFTQNAAGEFMVQVRKDALIVHTNGEKTNPIAFVSLRHLCPLIKYVCVIGSQRTHNMLLIQITEESVTLQAEQEIWKCVDDANGDLPPHSRVRRHQIVLIPASSSTLLPVNRKGEVIVREVETLFADQIDKVYKGSSLLAVNYSEEFFIGFKLESPFEQKRLMVALVRDVLSFVLGIDPGKLELEKSFQEQGVRSFEAMQVRNTLAAILGSHGQNLPATMLYDHSTIVLLAEWLVQTVSLGEVDIPKEVIDYGQRSEKMAIIGMGCRFGGGVKDMASFWELLSQGVDAVNLIPPDRWDWEKLWGPAGTPGKVNFCEGSFIKDHDQFDPTLFGILPKEAQQMDPQHRMILETTWEAIEHSGYSPDSLRGSNTGIFIGLLHHDYVSYVQKDHGDIMTIDTYHGTGNAFSAASGHISYLLDLRGPCLTVDTACSSSLVALQLACQSLQARESSQCIVGGANLILAPHGGVFTSKQQRRVLGPVASKHGARRTQLDVVPQDRASPVRFQKTNARGLEPGFIQGRLNDSLLGVSRRCGEPVTLSVVIDCNALKYINSVEMNFCEREDIVAIGNGILKPFDYNHATPFPTTESIRARIERLASSVRTRHSRLKYKLRAETQL